MFTTASRRHTRRAILSGLAGAALAPTPSAAAPTEARRPLSIQFFTFNALAGAGWDSFSKAMETCRRIGYDGVEFAGLFGHSPDRIRRHAEALGLSIPSTHIGNDQVRAFAPPAGGGPWAGVFGDAQDAAYTPLGVLQVCRVNLPLARDLGCEWGVIGAGGRANFASVDHVRRFCDALNRGQEVARQVGVKLSFHTHSIEFMPVEGRTPFDIMIENTDPAIRYQIDLGWAAVAGVDPASLIARHSQRIGLFHMKDMAADKKTVTCGDGILDFQAVWNAAGALDRPVYVMERDGGPGVDMVREAERGYRYLHRLGWGLRPLGA